jgi:hypothetical protein
MTTFRIVWTEQHESEFEAESPDEALAAFWLTRHAFSPGVLTVSDPVAICSECGTSQDEVAPGESCCELLPEPREE